MDRGDPGAEPAAYPPGERAWPGQDLRNDGRRPLAPKRDRQVVDLASHEAIGVHQLSIEQLETRGDPPSARHHFDRLGGIERVEPEAQADPTLLDRGDVRPSHDRPVRCLAVEVPGDGRRTAHVLALVAGPRSEAEPTDHKSINGQSRTEPPDPKSITGRGRPEPADRRSVLNEPDIAHPAHVAVVSVEDMRADQVREPHAPTFVMIINGIVATG